MQKRGQITIFIILGFVLVLVFSLVFFISSVEQDSFIQDTTKSQLSDTSAASFTSYLNDCIGKHTERTIDRIFKQGGRIAPEVDDYRSGNSFVSYALLNDVAIPFQVQKNSTLNLFSDSFPPGLFSKDKSNPYFGKNTLPKLCDKYGSNTINDSTQQNPFSCQLGLYGNTGQTVQNHIEDELSLDIASCFSNTMLQRQFDFSKTGSGDVDVTFSQDSVIVRVNDRIDFSNELDSIITPSFTYPLRAKKLYTAAYLLIEEDITNIFYDKKTNYSNVCRSCFEGISVSVHENVDEQSDLVILRDLESPLSYSVSHSIIDSYVQSQNDYLTVSFLVENRRPYIEFIEDIVVSGNDFSNISSPENRRTFQIPVIVHDPDENALSYETTVLSTSSLGNESFFENAAYNQDIVANCMADGLCEFTGSSGQENNPARYQETKYFVRVNVTDDSEFDYQEFSITVDPMR